MNDSAIRLERVEHQVEILASAVRHLAAAISEDARVREACAAISEWEPSEVDVARDDALSDAIGAGVWS